MKVGLVGFSCRTGIGELNRQMMKYGDISAWMIKQHPKKETIYDPDFISRMYLPYNLSDVESFVAKMDVLLFVEKPFYPEIIDLAYRLEKRTVCIPMQEWMPEDFRGWPEQVSLFLCPTEDCFEQMKEHVPCIYFPWPIDIDRYTFKARDTCKEFLFLNGNGGWRGRKGSGVITTAVSRWKDFPLIVHSQIPLTLPQNLIIQPEADINKSLYDRGDVLICPHSVDGLCLEPLEAAACGLPSILTRGEPWNEYPAIGRIDASQKYKKVARKTKWHFPDPKNLVHICKNLLGTDIASHSLEARAWAESRDWNKWQNLFNHLIRYGVPNESNNS